MKRSIALLLVVMFLPTLALAGPAEDKGLEIAKEAEIQIDIEYHY